MNHFYIVVPPTQCPRSSKDLQNKIDGLKEVKNEYYMDMQYREEVTRHEEVKSLTDQETSSRELVPQSSGR